MTNPAKQQAQASHGTPTPWAAASKRQAGDAPMLVTHTAGMTAIFIFNFDVLADKLEYISAVIPEAKTEV